MNSAAMQDHLMKKFKVETVDPFKAKAIRKPPVHRVNSGPNG